MSTERAERQAVEAAEAAARAIRNAIAAYQAAGFGSQVTDALRCALEDVRHSIKEVTS